MIVHRWYRNYADAEAAADYVKGDTQTEEEVRVVEDFGEPRRTHRFAVVVGAVDYDDRYEVQYTA